MIQKLEITQDYLFQKENVVALIGMYIYTVRTVYKCACAYNNIRVE